MPSGSCARTFAAAARDARRVRLAGATHLANLDRPAAFSEAVRRFARSLGLTPLTRSGRAVDGYDCRHPTRPADPSP